MAEVAGAGGEEVEGIKQRRNGAREEETGEYSNGGLERSRQEYPCVLNGGYFRMVKYSR